MIAAGHMGEGNDIYNSGFIGTAVASSLQSGSYFNLTCFCQRANSDSARIVLHDQANDYNANNFIYLNDSIKNQQLTSNLGADDYAVGDYLCKIGMGTLYYLGNALKCGQVMAEGGTFRSPFNGVFVDHQTQVSFATWPGDSGAPVYGIGSVGNGWAGVTAASAPDNSWGFVSIPKYVKLDINITPCATSAC
jgi:hypothetical protein